MTDPFTLPEIIILSFVAGLLIGWHFGRKPRNKPSNDFTGGDFPQDHQ